jgi:hypothetical protein
MKLIRDDQNEVRTLGALFDGEERICETLELPWRNNERGVSCIKEGTYECKLLFSQSRKMRLYWLQRVPGREAVQIHIGNFPKDIRGCILVGEERGKDQVVHSKRAFEKFMERMKGQDFFLTIESKKGSHNESKDMDSLSYRISSGHGMRDSKPADVPPGKSGNDPGNLQLPDPADSPHVPKAGPHRGTKGDSKKKESHHRKA